LEQREHAGGVGDVANVGRLPRRAEEDAARGGRRSACREGGRGGSEGRGEEVAAVHSEECWRQEWRGPTTECNLRRERGVGRARSSRLRLPEGASAAGFQLAARSRQGESSKSSSEAKASSVALGSSIVSGLPGRWGGVSASPP